MDSFASFGRVLHIFRGENKKNLNDMREAENRRKHKLEEVEKDIKN
jgi:hypothetical protein